MFLSDIMSHCHTHQKLLGQITDIWQYCTRVAFITNFCPVKSIEKHDKKVAKGEFMKTYVNKYSIFTRFISWKSYSPHCLYEYFNRSELFVFVHVFVDVFVEAISWNFELGIRESMWWAAHSKSETKIKTAFEWKISLNCLIVVYFQRVLRIMHDNFIKLNHNDFCNVMQIWN